MLLQIWKLQAEQVSALYISCYTMVKHHPANLFELTTVSGAMVVKCPTDLLYIVEPIESQVADEFDARVFCFQLLQMQALIKVLKPSLGSQA